MLIIDGEEQSLSKYLNSDGSAYDLSGCGPVPISIEDVTVDRDLVIRHSAIGQFKADNVAFLGTLAITNTLVMHTVTLCGCTFGKGVDFTDSKVEDPFRIEFPDGRGSISRICFAKSSLNYTKFDRMEIGELDMNECHSSMSFVLRGCGIGYMNLDNALVEGAIDLTGCEIGKMSMSRTSVLGEIVVDWSDIHQSHLADGNELEGYKILKNNMARTGEYRLEDQAYVEYKRAERRNIDTMSRFGTWKYFISWLEDSTGSYGTDPFKTLGSILVIIAMYSFAIFFNGLATGDFMSYGTDSDWSNFWQSVLTSFASFTTLVNFNECSCVSTKIILISEAFVGLFMMMYLSVSFARRVLR